MNRRAYFGSRRIQKRLSDCSDIDSDGEDKSEHQTEDRKSARRKATDILAEVNTYTTLSNQKIFHAFMNFIKRFPVKIGYWTCSLVKICMQGESA